MLSKCLFCFVFVLSIKNAYSVLAQFDYNCVFLGNTNEKCTQYSCSVNNHPFLSSVSLSLTGPTGSFCNTLGGSPSSWELNGNDAAMQQDTFFQLTVNEDLRVKTLNFVQLEWSSSTPWANSERRFGMGLGDLKKSSNQFRSSTCWGSDVYTGVGACISMQDDDIYMTWAKDGRLHTNKCSGSIGNYNSCRDDIPGGDYDDSRLLQSYLRYTAGGTPSLRYTDNKEFSGGKELSRTNINSDLTIADLNKVTFGSHAPGGRKDGEGDRFYRFKVIINAELFDDPSPPPPPRCRGRRPPGFP